MANELIADLRERAINLHSDGYIAAAEEITQAADALTAADKRIKELEDAAKPKRGIYDGEKLVSLENVGDFIIADGRANDPFFNVQPLPVQKVGRQQFSELFKTATSSGSYHDPEAYGLVVDSIRYIYDPALDLQVTAKSL